ncbi:MAG: hypothetical protein Q4D38_10155 [Planctomycetia bacterium]|nr:hypothetical protein [Planctomycetia bacterium]
MVRLFPDLELLSIEIWALDKNQFSNLTDAEEITSAQNNVSNLNLLRNALGEVKKLPKLRSLILFGTSPSISASDLREEFKEYQNLQLYDSNGNL